MPPILASLVCVGYVLVLLRLDRREAPSVSGASWLPTVWMLLISGKSVGRWFGTESSDVDGSSLDRAVLSALICLGLLITAKRQVDLGGIIRRNRWLFVLVAFMLISIAWSGMPFIAFKRWIREFGAIVMALVVLSERDPRATVESILRRTTYIFIPLSLLLIKYYQDYGIDVARYAAIQERMWIGVTVHKNGLGRLCLISILFLVWCILSRRRGNERVRRRYQVPANISVIVIGVYLMVGSPESFPATAVVALEAGVATLLALLLLKRWHIQLGKTTVAILVVSMIALGVMTVLRGGTTVGGFSSTVGRDETLTGRTRIWEILLPLFEQKAILGYGFGSFWTADIGESMLQQFVWGAGEAHNGYLEVGLKLGVVGVLLTALFLVASALKAQKALAQEYDWASLSLSYLFVALLHNITESSFDSFGRQLMMVLLLMSMSVSETSRREQPSAIVQRWRSTSRTQSPFPLTRRLTGQGHTERRRGHELPRKVTGR